MWDGAPTDYNIEEEFGERELHEQLRAFANNTGSNVLTVTVADPATFEKATTQPERFDLLRVRMGGWTEFFTAMFPDSQQQHRRRPFNTPSAP